MTIDAARVEQLGVRLQQAAQLGGVTERRGIVERRDSLQHHGRAALALLVLSHEELERSVAGALGDLVDTAARAVRGARVEAVPQRAPHGLDVAGAGGGEDALALGGVHGGLERAPGREAVVTRHQPLGVG